MKSQLKEIKILTKVLLLFFSLYFAFTPLVALAAEVNTDGMAYCLSQHLQYFSCKPCTASSSQAAGQGGGGGCGSTDPSKVEDNKKQIWDFLKSKGLSDYAAAGIMGNMQQESGFMPNADNSPSFGLGCRGVVQWCFGRETAMEEYQKKNNRPNWDCLGGQLDYMWYELTETGEAGVMEHLNGATNASDAGNIFAVEYERMKPSEQAGRDSNAQKIYDQFVNNGGAPTSSSGSAQALSNSSSSSSSSSGASCATQSSTGPSTPGSLPQGECPDLIEKVKSLEASGKIVFQNKDAEVKDIENCGKVTHCSGGVEKKTLQVLIAIAEQSGQPAKVSALNGDHPCDNGEHGKGLGIDIAYAAGTPEGEQVYKFLYDNAGTLGTNKLIFDQPPSGYQCMYAGKPTPCETTYADSIADHKDHIHVSL